MQKIVAYLLTSLIFCTVAAQDKSNRGKEFWLGYGFNYGYFNDPPVNQQELALYISTELPATVTVSINSTGWTQTVNIPANTVNATILIPKSGPNDARILTDGLSTRGIHIESNVPVAVYAHVYALMVSGATMLMPVESYGYKYYSINYYQTTSQSSPNDWYSWFYAVASEDNTRLEITPSDTTKNGWLPGVTYTVNLNKGEIFNVFGKAVFNSNPDSASKDMTGSKIVSVPGNDAKCHPFALFSGSGGIRLCRGDGGEFMQQQIFPAQAWGTRYLTHHTLNNTNTNINATFRNYYRICVQDPTTVVRKNGVVMTGLIKNFFYEHMDSTGGDYFTADKPIMVSQYTPNKNQCWAFNNNQYGDPEMIYLSPIEQGQKSVLFYTSSKFGIDYVYANITVPTAGISSLLVDGVPLPAAQIKVHPNNPAYSVAFANLGNVDMQHTISSDSAFTAIVNGIGYFESYGYNVGTLINNLNFYSEIKNTNNTNNQPDTFTCRNSPIRLFLKIASPLTSIHWKLSQVPGLFPNADSIISNPAPVYSEQINGRNYFVYSLQQNFTVSNYGTFYVPVTYTSPVTLSCNQQDSATVKIIVVTPGPIADFSMSPLNCLKDTIHFTGTSVAPGYNIVNYLWNFDDATTQNTVNAAKLFAASGIQNVRYRIYTDNGCIGDTTKTLTIFPSPTAIVGASSPICAGDSVLISDTSTITSGTITSWRYDFGDATTLVRTTNTPFYHTYNAPGTYTIKLVTTSNQGCISDTGYRTVTVFAKPVALFGSTNNICIRDSVYITDTSSVAIGIISSWRYDFGDGNTLVRNNNSPFYHPYNTAGTFILSLVTVSDMGCVSDTFRRTIIVNDRPRADFNIASLYCLKDTIDFNHIPPPGTFNITGYLWNFDDATTQTTIDARKKFATSGVQNIRYRIFTAEGCTGDTTKQITINPDPVSKPGILPTGCTTEPMLITDTSAISSGSIVSWYYDFGDGNTLIRTTNTAFTHTYTGAGTFTLTLITTSALGCESDTAKRTIIISEKPLAPFSFTGTPCVGNTFTFTSGYTNTAGTSWYWDFGDGQVINTTAGNTTTHIYSSALTNITVKHVVNIAGSVCRADTSFSVIPVMHPKPVAAFSIKKDTACENIPLAFSSATVGVSNWDWNFGNGTGAAAPPFTRMYTNAGTYPVSLIVTDVNNCQSLPATDVLVINPTPAVNAGPDKIAYFGYPVMLDASVLPSSVYNYLWTPPAGLSANNILRPMASPSVNTTYLLTAEDVNTHCKSSDAVFVKSVAEVYIPNAFSPNGDNLNDKWEIPSLAEYPNAVVIVFNRYGNKIFETRNYANNRWDGTFKGAKQPAGSYVYYINLNDKRNQVFQGLVTIIR